MHLRISRMPAAALAAVCLTGSLLLTQPLTAEAAGGRPARVVVAGYSGEQLANAGVIVAVAATRHLPVAAAVLGVATAMGESTLRNLSYGDNAINPDGTVADSVGLFQQQHWWGTKAQRMTPAYAAAAFYAHLERVRGWEGRTPTAAIHAVQGNADPHYYTRFVPAAVRVVRYLVSHPGAAARFASAYPASTVPRYGGAKRAGSAHLTYRLPKITVPKIDIPTITIPDLTIPDVTIPDVTAPVTGTDVTATDAAKGDATKADVTAATTGTGDPADPKAAGAPAGAGAAPLTSGDLGLEPLDPVDLGDWATGWEVGSIDDAISGAFADGLGTAGGTFESGDPTSTSTSAAAPSSSSSNGY